MHAQFSGLLAVGVALPDRSISASGRVAFLKEGMKPGGANSSKAADFLRRLACLFGLLLPAMSAHAQTCMTQTANPSAPPRQLYVVAGQSNAVGLASVKDIDSRGERYAQENTTYSNVSIYGIYGAPPGVAGNDDAARSRAINWSYFARWRVAGPGFGYKNLAGNSQLFPFGTKSTDFFGPELYLAHFLNNKPPRDHYIAKLAISNTSLNYTASADSWMPGGRLYHELLAVIADAYNSKRANVRLRVGGLFFMQGETDALNEVWAKNYKNNLKNFITRIRRDVSDMGCSDEMEFPVIIGRIQDNPAWTYRKYVRSAQMDVARSLPQVGIVDTDDFAEHLVAGGVHFNEYGQFHLGARAYQALVGRAAIGNLQSVVWKKVKSKRQNSTPITEALERVPCCKPGDLIDRQLQKYFPWTYGYGGACRGYACAPVY
ncbi:MULTISPECIES: sialate O-acetylesterase [unclassified Acidovorax]|uniref:sialate O-acetylesterase n=1 Tax=unclassified Acidovorax TaxID=2684926 RepID=UPI001C471951|nr:MULTISPECIES: sialate O-acetylesterase [unclassified Acidovorax]MBV7428185.1 sialate O-acetylesterase [Acidovorax sp. sif0732]MBV7449442.1 sialate O-acetylesterase [Acidovorax sp. sif0715]